MFFLYELTLIVPVEKTQGFLKFLSTCMYRTPNWIVTIEAISNQF